MGPNDRKRLCRGIQAFLLEGSEAEWREALSGSSESFDDLVAEGRAAARAALNDDRSDDGDPDLQRSLGALVHLLRRRDGLTYDGLAARADVDAEEVRCIETDPHFEANPRTIFQLERCFGLKPRSLVLLSGAIQVESSVRAEALRFAAKSDGLAKLNSDEIKLLKKFVKFLGEHSDG